MSPCRLKGGGDFLFYCHKTCCHHCRPAGVAQLIFYKKPDRNPSCQDFILTLTVFRSLSETGNTGTICSRKPALWNTKTIMVTHPCRPACMGTKAYFFYRAEVSAHSQVLHSILRSIECPWGIPVLKLELRNCPRKNIFDQKRRITLWQRKQTHG